MKKLIDRFQLYNKGMKPIDWNDANVLRKLPDGWYSVPSDSKYGKMIIKDPDIKFNDSVKRAKERHERVLKKEKKIDEFIKSEPLRDVPCDHKNYSHKGHLICAVCGLMKKDFNPFAYNEGDESRVHVTNKRSERNMMNELCVKAITILRRIIDDLDIDRDIVLDDILDVFRTYVLTSDDSGRRNFRISARPEGLCAALLWRDLQIKKVPMTMLEFSKRIKMDRMTVSCIFKRLDDFKDLHVGKCGRPKRK